jgi:hypothetical protein
VDGAIIAVLGLTATSGSDGKYTISGVGAGIQSVACTYIQGESTQTAAPNPASVTVVAGGTVTQDFVFSVS